MVLLMPKHTVYTGTSTWSSQKRRGVPCSASTNLVILVSPFCTPA